MTDFSLLNCPTYENYLDSFITKRDLRYIRVIQTCRVLVKLGYRSATELYSPEEFEKRKKWLDETLNPTKKAWISFSENFKGDDDILRELAVREKPNAQKIISTIIFLKQRGTTGFEISGYIDYENSLRRASGKREDATDWEGVFAGRVLLQPKKTHLSYFDWHKCEIYTNDTDNYEVVHDVEHGLVFMHKGDHKKICVDITQDLYKGNCTRAVFFSEAYGSAIFYDHVVRKKN